MMIPSSDAVLWCSVSHIVPFDSHSILVTDSIVILLLQTEEEIKEIDHCRAAVWTRNWGLWHQIWSLHYVFTLFHTLDLILS